LFIKKAVLSVALNSAQRHAGVWKNRGIVPRIHNLTSILDEEYLRARAASQEEKVGRWMEKERGYTK
jgi:hypothetical protein